MDKTIIMGTEKIGKLLLKFSLPAITGMLVNALYNIVDRIYIGHIKNVGPYALSGLAITFPISTIIMAFGMLIGLGATAVISIKLGEKNKESAEKILGNAVILNIIISIVVSIAGLMLLDKLLLLFGASEKSLPYAKDYITIILFGVIFQNLGFGTNNIIRAEGNPKMAMLTMIFGAIINIILDPIFIFTFKMGIEGAAIATVIAQAFNTFWVLNYFCNKKSGSILKLKKKNMKISLKVTKDIFSIGMSPFSMQVAASIVVLLYNRGLRTYGGDLAVAAFGIINSISLLIFMPIFGINQGSQPIIGFNYGANAYHRVKETLKIAILSATAICLIGYIGVQIFPEFLMKAFVGNNTDLIKLGAHGIRIDLIFLPIIGLQIVGTNYFQAIREAKTSMLLSILRQVVVLIPCILIFPKLGGLGLNGLWASQPAADIIASVLTIIFLIKSIKGLKEKSIVSLP